MQSQTRFSGYTQIAVFDFITPLQIVPASALVTYQLGIGVVILLLVTDLNHIENIMADEYVAAGLVFGLGVLGAGVAYIPPIVALVTGGLIVGERIVFWEYLGAAFILLGVVLINRKTVN